MPSRNIKINISAYIGVFLSFILLSCLLLFFSPKFAEINFLNSETLIFFGLFTAAVLLWQFYRQHVLAYLFLALGILIGLFFEISHNIIDSQLNINALPVQNLGTCYSALGHNLFSVFVLISAFQMENIIDFRKIRKIIIWNLLFTITTVAVVLGIYGYLLPGLSPDFLNQYLTADVFHYLTMPILLIAVVKFYTNFLQTKHKIYFWLASGAVMVLFGAIAEILNQGGGANLYFGFILISFSFFIFGLFEDNGRFVETETRLRQDLENSLFAAEENTQKLEAILDQTDIGFGQIDGSFRFVSMNKKIPELLGFKAAELMGKSLSNFLDLKGKELLRNAKEKLDHGKEVELEIDFYSKSKQSFQCLLNIFPSPGKKSIFLGGKFVLRDVSVQKKQEAEREKKVSQLEKALLEKTSGSIQFEEELKKSESFYSSILAGVSEIILIVNNNGKCIYVNEAGQKISGFKTDELNKNNLPRFLPDLSRVKADYGPSISMDFRDYEYDWKAKNGKLIPCTWNVQILKDHENKRIGLIGFGRESSTKKKFEQQIEEIKNQSIKKLEQKDNDLLKIQSSIDFLLKQSMRFTNEQSIEPFLTSICKTIRFYGCQGAAIFLYENKSERYKRKASSFLQKHESVMNHLEKFLNSGEVKNLKNTMKMSGSFLYEVQIDSHVKGKVLLSPLVSNGETTGWLATIQQKQDREPDNHWVKTVESLAEYAQTKIASVLNIMDVEARFKDLQKSEEVKSEFMDYMSHEIRTPLNSILTISEVLQKHLSGPLNPDQFKQIDLVKQNADKILYIINDILDLSKIKSGNRDLSYSYFSLPALVQSIIAPLKPLCQKKSLTLDVKIQKQVPKQLFSDKDKITQSLTNILSNAVKFTDSGKITVAITCERQGSILRFVVRDSGIGIPREKLSTIFQEFRQLRGSKDSAKGSGLGLSIAKKLVETLGGTIHVESKLKKGTTFQIDLPLKKVGEIVVAGLSTSSTVFPKDGLSRPGQKSKLKPSPVRMNAKNRAVSDLKSAKLKSKNNNLILLIDDDEGGRYATELFLKEEGFRVISSGDGKEGIMLAKKEKPDLILMDVVLPGTNGYDAAKKLKTLKSTSKIPIIATTGKALKNDRIKAMDAGCVDYLTKPFSLENLLKKVNKWI